MSFYYWVIRVPYILNRSNLRDSWFINIFSHSLDYISLSWWYNCSETIFNLEVLFMYFSNVAYGISVIPNNYCLPQDQEDSPLIFNAIIYMVRCRSIILPFCLFQSLLISPFLLSFGLFKYFIWNSILNYVYHPY